jgi:hypothetical protein
MIDYNLKYLQALFCVINILNEIALQLILYVVKFASKFIQYEQKLNKRILNSCEL